MLVSRRTVNVKQQERKKQPGLEPRSCVKEMTWAPVPNSPYDLRGRKATLKKKTDFGSIPFGLSLLFLFRGGILRTQKLRFLL